MNMACSYWGFLLATHFHSGLTGLMEQMTPFLPSKVMPQLNHIIMSSLAPSVLRHTDLVAIESWVGTLSMDSLYMAILRQKPLASHYTLIANSVALDVMVKFPVNKP